MHGIAACQHLQQGYILQIRARATSCTAVQSLKATYPSQARSDSLVKGGLRKRDAGELVTWRNVACTRHPSSRSSAFQLIGPPSPLNKAEPFFCIVACAKLGQSLDHFVSIATVLILVPIANDIRHTLLPINDREDGRSSVGDACWCSCWTCGGDVCVHMVVVPTALQEGHSGRYGQS